MQIVIGTYRLPYSENYMLQITVLIDSYCKNSYLADQVADLPPLKWQFVIGTYRFILWELICGRSGIDRFLLWELISGRSGGRSTPQNWQFSICSDRFLLWELISGRSGGRSTPQKWQFAIGTYRFILWELICGNSGTDRFLLWELISGRSAGRSPPRNGNLQLVLIPDSYSTELISGRSGIW